MPFTSQASVMPGKPVVGKVERKLLEPQIETASCIYLTAHAARRLNDPERNQLGIKAIGTPPFTIHTYYCEADDIDRPVWALPIAGSYILGRWEESLRTDVPYRQWFVATTCITDRQFKNSHLVVVKSIPVNVIRVMNQLNFWSLRKN